MLFKLKIKMSFHCLNVKKDISFCTFYAKRDILYYTLYLFDVNTSESNAPVNIPKNSRMVSLMGCPKNFRWITSAIFINFSFPFLIILIIFYSTRHRDRASVLLLSFRHFTFYFLYFTLIPKLINDKITANQKITVK